MHQTWTILQHNGPDCLGVLIASHVNHDSPRYGRNSELPGEDPMLTAEYGIAVVNAMQAS